MPHNADQLQMLLGFGYLSGDPTTFTDERVADATRLLQAMYGLSQTGAWDDVTARAVVRMPRCGVTDAGHAREALARWGAKSLNYFVAHYVDGPGLTPDIVKGIIRDAFTAWERVCGLKFTQVSDESKTHIYITKGRGRRAGFDGPSGTLAYAYLPNTDNFTGRLDLVLDMDEPWSPDGRGATVALLAVLVHEIGHTLGLEHTPTAGQVMQAIYDARIQLPQTEDSKRVVLLYGPPQVAPLPPPVTPLPGDADIQQLEVLLRVNNTQVYGPYKLDPTKRSSQIAALFASATG